MFASGVRGPNKPGRSPIEGFSPTRVKTFEKNHVRPTYAWGEHGAPAQGLRLDAISRLLLRGKRTVPLAS